MFEMSTAIAPRLEGVAPADLAVCEALLSRGSKSFSAASKLLPKRLRKPATIFYAFCRVADDLVDDSGDPEAAVVELHQFLDRVYRLEPGDDAVERALTVIVHEHRIPRGVLDALIDGFQWDADGRSYDSESDIIAYSARVASAVGVVMSLLMGTRSHEALARACDLGAAMQLTNIARDVAEDAERGRCYLPKRWLAEAGIDPERFASKPVATSELAPVIARMLDRADELYRRADAGIGMLPKDCRAAIRAASLIYGDIGRKIREQGCDPTRGRAYTSKGRKLWLLLTAFVSATPKVHTDAPALREMGFLLEAVEA